MDNLGIDSLTIGVSHAGMEAYRDALRVELLQTTRDLINDFSEVESSINSCWQGQARDKFLDIFRQTREQIANDLEAEYNDLNSRIQELEYAYFKQDSNMIVE